jgi:hypothetical protein
MFVRVESGFKAGFSDPAAIRLQRKIEEIHPSLAEKIRWMRKLSVVWMEFDISRDKLVNAIQSAFKNPVTDWIFTGDLLPSAAGSSGTLYDLMQDSPFRPGVFHGIEKRKRLNTHDEEALLILDAIQTVLGRKSPSDRVLTGELLIIEGAKLNQSDLEWIARNWFSQDKDESWSLLSEEELKHNARFQSEQVAKYLVSQQTASRSRLLQFRSSVRGGVSGTDWKQVEESFRSRHAYRETPIVAMQTEDWNFYPDIRFSSWQLNSKVQSETIFNLVKHQLEHFVRGGFMQVQTLLAVLPEKNMLWRSEDASSHPVRIREDFERALERVAETTDTSLTIMKFYEETHENEPSYFWSTGVSIERNLQTYAPGEPGQIVDLFFIGFSENHSTKDLSFVENLKAVHAHALKGRALAFALPTAGNTLVECLKQAVRELQYGFDIVVDGIEDFIKKYLESSLPLGLIWGVNLEQRDWLVGELKARTIPFLHFGSTSHTSEARILEGGDARVSVSTSDFFKKITENAFQPESLLAKAIFLQERRVQPAKFRNRYSVEELVLKPEPYHVNVATPVVLRPSLQNWSGLMVLGDLCGQEFDSAYLDYLLRKCTAMGGQIHSVQVSFVNGLKPWWAVFEKFVKDYGIKVNCVQAKSVSEIQAHWMGLQIIAKVADVRTVRTEDFKYVNDRIYWLPGDFEHAATRWLAGFEGRNQNGLHGALAIESSQGGEEGVINTLIYGLLKRRLGAEVRIQHHFSGGFFVTVNENERFSVEEEWKTLGIEFEFVGRVTASPYLVLRNDTDQTRTISIEDIV